jgi:hypothetical protein
MGGLGEKFITRLLGSIQDQNFDISKIEIVISDHSVNYAIKNVCEGFTNLPIKYYRNELNRGSSSANLNNCISNSTGDYIKPIFQDDYLYNEFSLSEIYLNIPDCWGGYRYTHFNENSKEIFNERLPYYNENILHGNNTVGPPSCIIFKNENNLFDEQLLWFMDCEFYHRMYKKYGKMKSIDIQPCIFNTVWSGQVSNTSVTDEIIKREMEYINRKYDSN